MVIAIIAILAALLLPALARAKQKGQQAVCLSNLKQIGLAFQMYLNDHNDRFADRRDLKSSLPGGYHPWTTWPPSDPARRLGGDCVERRRTADALWSCPASVNSYRRETSCNPCKSAPTTDTNPPSCATGPGALTGPMIRWGWRIFGARRNRRPSPILQSTNDPTVGLINGASDVELVVDPYYPSTVPTVAAGFSGHTIHAGGRCRVFLDGHVQFIRDTRTPL